MGLVFVGGVKGSQNKGDLKKKAVRLTAPSCRFLGLDYNSGLPFSTWGLSAEDAVIQAL